ncbi:alpha-amylase family glycosyl hydrolase [Ferruginibacter albus]|uniref:alpha-amylase family glycosyl hydrolase n=1 Tax=Ferruginibacter albus TaxID=2875540 RepID=UPI001CC70DA0|nr:alpha-amylase family glycosyl hydrolase [Ferruginibacter albus]UAY51604.1 alpha-glucosidase C-terminal domain-containing protein [Ferruginibacter albus]
MKLSPKRLLISILLLAFLKSNAQTPSWILNGNIYEVNVRQYTPEGTFKAFEKQLPRLKQMGAQTLWFMPINPISKKDRKGSLGSYYAIADYGAINPEYGTLQDWKQLVNKAHSLGFKVIIDWVANHTGADNYWIEKHSDFYAKDSAGNLIAPFDWTDTRKLNYNNHELADSMIAVMKYWITETNIDGFRCDVAGEVPDAFWQKCIPELRKLKNIFMLAEGEKPELNKDGFNATYTWSVFNVMKDIVKGTKDANSLDSAINNYDTTFPKGSLHMYFTSNHDENSWNKADYETTPGITHAPFALLTQTMKSGVPLIYSGQEEPFLRAIRFFDKDTISFSKYQRAAFYTTLLKLKKLHPALNPAAAYKRIATDNDKNVFAYYRYVANRFVLVVLNLSNTKQVVHLKDFTAKTSFDIFKKETKTVSSFSTLTLAPWDYKVLIDNDATLKLQF